MNSSQAQADVDLSHWGETCQRRIAAGEHKVGLPQSGGCQAVKEGRNQDSGAR